MEGYTIRKYNPYMDKALVPKIAPGSKGCFLDELIKSKRNINVA